MCNQVLSCLLILHIVVALVIATGGEDVFADQEKRVALVIGNSAYELSPLSNPVNDAEDMATVLAFCEFEVIMELNADRRTMRRAIRKFGDAINKGAVGLFFYAGHGLQVDGENYLVPVGAAIHNEDEIEDECLKVSSVLRKMETAGNRLNIIILDACRNNPFERRFRSGTVGLAKMDAPMGTILAYATAPGMTAADGTEKNGLYTSHLLRYMLVPGLKIEDVFKQVRIHVAAKSANKQIPWEVSSLMGDFSFLNKSWVTKGKSTPKIQVDQLVNMMNTPAQEYSLKRNTKGLVLHLPLDGNAQDQSGFNHKTKEKGTISYVPSLQKMAAFFDGTSSIEILNSPKLNSEKYTLTAWIRPMAQIPTSIISKDGLTSDRQYRLAYEKGGLIRPHSAKKDGRLHSIDTINGGRLDAWFFVAQTFDGETLKAYVDGANVTGTRPTTSEGGVLFSTQPVRIGGNGAQHGTNQNFKGYIDDVRVYNRALSHEEIYMLFLNSQDLTIAKTPFDSLQSPAKVLGSPGWDGSEPAAASEPIMPADMGPGAPTEPWTVGPATK